MDTEPEVASQEAIESTRVFSSGVCGEASEDIDADCAEALDVARIEDFETDRAEALDLARIEEYEQERSYQRDMSYARAALQRGPLVLRHMKSHRERRARAARTRAAASSASSGDSSPPPSSDPPARAVRALAPHLTGGA